MRRLHIATEEEMAAIDAAIDADKKAQSTNPLDVADVSSRMLISLFVAPITTA